MRVSGTLNKHSFARCVDDDNDMMQASKFLRTYVCGDNPLERRVFSTKEADMERKAMHQKNLQRSSSFAIFRRSRSLSPIPE